VRLKITAALPGSLAGKKRPAVLPGGRRCRKLVRARVVERGARGARQVAPVKTSTEPAAISAGTASARVGRRAGGQRWLPRTCTGRAARGGLEQTEYF
jgi:hypothetical protein